MTLRGPWLAVLLVAGTAVAAADELDTSYQSLQEAVAKKDAAQVKKLAVDAYEIARKEASSSAPEGVDADTWKQRVAYVKDLEVQIEYAIYATAVQTEPASQVDLLATLEQQNPKSKYLDEGYGVYLVALTKTGAAAKVPEIAEKGLANFPENPDLLSTMANSAFAKKQMDRALTFANRLVASLTKHPNPARNSALGNGYYIAGIVSAERNQYPNADRNLRAALPYLKGSDAMLGPALYYLGIANYNLGKMTLNKAKVLEGAGFCDQSAKIAWPNQQQAWRDAQLIRAEGGKMR